MIQLKICDDEPHTAAIIREYCEKWSSETGIDLVCNVYYDADSLLASHPEDNDIVMLDIQMEGVNGMEAAHMLRQQSNQTIIIFITNMLSYAIEGYEVKASHFIPKPISYDQVCRALKDSVATLQARQNDVLMLETPTGFEKIVAEDIIFVESARNKIVIHLRDRVCEQYGSMKSIEEQLPQSRFFRVHSGYLVNLKEISQVNGLEARMSTGDTVLISKHRKKDFVQAFVKVMGDSLL